MADLVKGKVTDILPLVRENLDSNIPFVIGVNYRRQVIFELVNLTKGYIKIADDKDIISGVGTSITEDSLYNYLNMQYHILGLNNNFARVIQNINNVMYIDERAKIVSYKYNQYYQKYSKSINNIEHIYPFSYKLNSNGDMTIIGGNITIDVRTVNNTNSNYESFINASESLKTAFVLKNAKFTIRDVEVYNVECLDYLMKMDRLTIDFFNWYSGYVTRESAKLG